MRKDTVKMAWSNMLCFSSNMVNEWAVSLLACCTVEFYTEINGAHDEAAVYGASITRGSSVLL